MALFNFSNNNKRTILIGLGALAAAVVIDFIIAQIFGDSVGARVASLVVLVVAAVIAIPMTVNTYIDNRRGEMGEEHAAPMIEEFRRTKDRKKLIEQFDQYLDQPNTTDTKLGVLRRLSDALIEDGYLKDARKLLAASERIAYIPGAKPKYDKAVAEIEARIKAAK